MLFNKSLILGLGIALKRNKRAERLDNGLKEHCMGEVGSWGSKVNQTRWFFLNKSTERLIYF